MMLSSVSLALRAARQKKNGALFLKGPLTFSWIAANIPDPASRLIMVVQAFMDIEGVGEVVLTKKIWEAAAISGKDARHRVLDKIRNGAKGYEVNIRKGCLALLRRR
jgi:hypothetical protein